MVPRGSELDVDMDGSAGWCVEGAKIIELCEKGDKLLDEEIAKVYKGKKITKGTPPRNSLL